MMIENLFPLVVWILLSVVALVLLRSRQTTLTQTATAVWAVLIVVVPILGAAAFLIVDPGRQQGVHE
jgi:hypothetical protein